jgi:hypothetical protein
MGNALFTEETEVTPFDYNLESPEADSQLNGGTAAPNCQPKHSMELDRAVEQQQQSHGTKHGRTSETTAASSKNDSND